MKTHLWAAVFCLTSLVLPARAELWVDQAASADGDGSPDAPFVSIGRALRAAQAGDTITIRQGTYREVVNLSVSGTAERPTVLRAAPGQRVVLSGFAPLGDWKPEADGLYSTTIDGPLGDLYVGLQPQPVARWPDLDLPFRYVVQPQAAPPSFQDAADLPDEPFLKAVAAEPKSLAAFLYVAQGNYFSTVPVTRLDPPTRTLMLAPERGTLRLQGKAGRSQDRYQLVNHPSLIRQPGQWAFQTLDGRRSRVFFRPAAATDLERTQYRQAPAHLLMIGTHGRTVSHVRVEGLEICGSAQCGLQIQGAEHVAVTRCLIHNNTGNGIFSRRSNQVELTHNVIVANGYGVGIASARGVLVAANEIGLNMVDGITVAGNVTGRPGGEPETADVTLRRNYVHHHLYLSHPDNIQAYRGVKDLTIEDNVLLFGGQAIMTEEVDGATLRNTVAVGTGAVAVIFGHGNSHRWTVENCTVGLGGWGAFSLTGEGYRLRNNILWNNALGGTASLTSDYNLFCRHRDEQTVYHVSKPRWRNFTRLADVAQATQQEQHSRRARPAFRHAPFCQAATVWDDANRADRLALRVGGAGVELTDFQPGDRIEINGDGVLRRITAVDGQSLCFAPPLPQRPLRDALVWNWKAADSTALDLRPAADSPALTAGADGKPVGATLDIPAFQRGDFDGDGQRDIPDLPPDVRDALPHPNAVVVPLQGA